MLHVLRLAADLPEARVLLLANVGELGGKKDLVAAALDGFADELFVVADAVGVCGVEEVDTEVERAEKCGGGLGIVALAVELAHTHAAQTHL